MLHSLLILAGNSRVCINSDISVGGGLFLIKQWVAVISKTLLNRFKEGHFPRLCFVNLLIVDSDCLVN